MSFSSIKNVKIKKSGFLKALFFAWSFLTMTLISNAQEKLPSIEEILFQIDTLKTNSEKVTRLNKLAGRLRYTEETYQLLDTSLAISTRTGNSLLIANSYYALGNYYYFNSKLDSSLYALKISTKYVEETDNTLLKATIQTTLGGVHSKEGNIQKAIAVYLDAKTLLDKVDTLQLTDVELKKFKGNGLVLNNSIANLYNKMEDYPMALIYYDKAYHAAIKLKSIPNASIILNNKGNLLNEMEQFKEGLEVLLKAKKLKLEAKLPQRFIATSDLNIGSAYIGLNNKEKALTHLNAALKINEERNIASGKMETLIVRGNLFLSDGEIKKAVDDCSLGKEIALSINDAKNLIKACKCLYVAQELTGDYKASLVNHKLYTRVKDSIFNERNIRKTSQLELQYELNQNKAEQQFIIDKKNRQTNQILIGLIVSVIFILTLIAFFRKRLNYQKTISAQEKTLQQQNIIELQQKNKLTAMSSVIEGQEMERLRIAKDLHDGLGGLLSSIKAHYTAFTSEKEPIKNIELSQKTNHLIDEACGEVRRISHNMMPHTISVLGLEGAIQDIADRLNNEGISTDFESNNKTNLGTTKQIALYRLTQEIVSNIRKHANASNVLIQLFSNENEINLTIEDDGKGFDYDKAISQNGLGLKNINSRVTFLDGTINWDARVNEGTTVNINIPIE